MTSQVKIKWGKDLIPVTIDLASTTSVALFKQQLEATTGVPVAGQKIMLPNGPLKDDTNLANLNGKTLMLLGSANTASVAAAAAATKAHHAFAEDMILTGLANDGTNTDYLNCAVQFLRAIPQLRQGRCGDVMNTVPTLRELGRVFDELDACKVSKINPSDFFQSFLQAFPQPFAQRSMDWFPNTGGFAVQDPKMATDALLSLFQNTMSTPSSNTDGSCCLLGARIGGADDVNSDSVMAGQVPTSVPFIRCDLNDDTKYLEDGIELFLARSSLNNSDDAAEATGARGSSSSASSNGAINSNNSAAAITGLGQYVGVHVNRFGPYNAPKGG